MDFHINEMVSEVTLENESPAAGAPKTVKWEELARVRETQARIARDRSRTAAEEYDD